MKNIIITNQPEKQLSKEQKQFNRLNSQIIKEKDLLLNWQNKISEFKTIYANELLPLESQYDKLRIQIVCLLDEIFDNKIFTKNERKKMLYVIEGIARDLADVDETVKAIYNRRGNNDFDNEQVIMKEMTLDYIKETAVQQFGVDLEDMDISDLDINDPQGFMQKFTHKMQEKMEKDEGMNQKNDSKIPEKKVSKKEQEISQSIKEVYRQLAKTLHPDRETDPDEKIRKNELMQQINSAYNKNDLLTLLQMQLEIEQIDQNSINSISLEKIKHFNIILKRQLEEIKQEIYFTEENFNNEFQIPEFGGIFSPNKIVMKLKIDINEITNEIKQLKNDLNNWKNPQYFKIYLKNMSIPKNYN